jgi:hypothetical protein
MMMMMMMMMISNTITISAGSENDDDDDSDKNNRFQPKEASFFMQLQEESHVGMKLYDSRIYCVFWKKSASSAPAGSREFLCSFYVYIFDINMKTECDSLMYVWGE